MLRPLGNGNRERQWLQAAATLMRTWIAATPAVEKFLKTRNDIDMVLVLTGTGPQYRLKIQTVNCKRLHRKVYFDNTFANVLLSLMLKSQGKSETTFLELHRHYVSHGSPCALLGTRNRLTRRRLMEAVWSLPELCNFRKQLIDSNSERDEWLILSHDATFKSLFTFLGQEKMKQQEGELHALHSVLGITGALAGLSLQSSEGPDSFTSAMCDILPLSARQKTRWSFSDTPSTIAKAATCLPHLLGIAEDPLHLVLRIEGCFGEKRTKLSSLLLRLQKKFTVAFNGSIYTGEKPAAGDEGHVLLFRCLLLAFHLCLQQSLSRPVSAQPRSRDISLEIKT